MTRIARKRLLMQLDERSHVQLPSRDGDRVIGERDSGRRIGDLARREGTRPSATNI